MRLRPNPAGGYARRTMKATRTIWKTVVFAGAMLGTAACGPKSTAPAADTSNAGGGEEAVTDDGSATGGEGYGDPCEGAWTDPCAGDPCGDRGRGDEEEPCNGRGFILS